jgi:hypothetical protein
VFQDVFVQAIHKEAKRRHERRRLGGPGLAIGKPGAQEDLGDIPGADDLEYHLIDTNARACITSTRLHNRRSSALPAALHGLRRHP